MREPINILKYGFLLFLVIVGVASVFNNEANFIASMDSLSIPIFAFSISILFVKANKFARDELFKRIQNREKTVNEQSKEVEQKGEALKKAEYANNKNLYENFKDMYKKSMISTKEMSFLIRYFGTIDIFTKIFNMIAMISFTWCLLSLIGLFAININFTWVNIFSLALVFFDFFVLDDLLGKAFKNKLNKLHEQAEKETEQEEVAI